MTIGSELDIELADLNYLKIPGFKEKSILKEHRSAVQTVEATVSPTSSVELETEPEEDEVEELVLDFVDAQGNNFLENTDFDEDVHGSDQSISSVEDDVTIAIDDEVRYSF
jgi:hypothetical protein